MPDDRAARFWHYGGVATDEAVEVSYHEDEHALLVALFRYGVIAPLVERAPTGEVCGRGAVVKLIGEITGRTHHLPGRGPLSLTARTVYGWLRDYRRGGIAALRPRYRKDRGQARVIDADVLARAVALRLEGYERHTKTVLDILKLEGTLRGKPVPHRATLDRHLRRRGASRRQLVVLGEKRTIKMVVAAFGQLWVGDYHHGPLVLGPDGAPTTAKLGAFIDHATRYPVADRYYLNENLLSLRDTLLRALLTWGPPEKAYTDRGAVYRAEQLAYSLLRLDCHLIHSRAYYSQGRGVIERWWQIADQFEQEVRGRDELLTIHELNRLWEAYRTRRYLEERHSELGKTPLEAIAAVVPKPLDPQVARELFLVRADRHVHKHDACVAVEGRRFLCESFLRGQQVQVRFDPGDLSAVLIFLDGQRVQRALPQVPNATPEPHPEPAQVRQSVDYLGLVREDYDRKLLAHARPLAYAQIAPDPSFDATRFVAVVSALAGLDGRPATRKELVAFFDTFAPLAEELVRIGTEHAIRLHGRGRHARVYLHAIRTLILAHLKRRPTPEEDHE